MDYIGFEKAHKQVVALINELSKKYKEIHVIGFSIGATIAWLCSDQKGEEQHGRICSTRGFTLALQPII